jgi:hypothetical protein
MLWITPAWMFDQSRLDLGLASGDQVHFGRRDGRELPGTARLVGGGSVVTGRDAGSLSRLARLSNAPTGSPA